MKKMWLIHLFLVDFLSQATVILSVGFPDEFAWFMSVCYIIAIMKYHEMAFVVVQSLSHVRLFAIPWTAARQALLSFIISQSLLKLMSIWLVMPSNHLALCCPLFLLPSIFPSGSSQCISPELPVSCNEPGLAICFTYDNIHVSMLFSQIIPPLPSPTESKSLFFTSVSLLLSHI